MFMPGLSSTWLPWASISLPTRVYSSSTAWGSKVLARQVAAVGNNLNQLARIANFNGKAEDAYLQEAQQIMTRIWLLMKEQL